MGKLLKGVIPMAENIVFKKKGKGKYLSNALVTLFHNSPKKIPRPPFTFKTFAMILIFTTLFGFLVITDLQALYNSLNKAVSGKDRTIDPARKNL